MVWISVLRVVEHFETHPEVNGEEDNRHNDDQRRQGRVHGGGLVHGCGWLVRQLTAPRADYDGDLRLCKDWNYRNVFPLVGRGLRPPGKAQDQPNGLHNGDDDDAVDEQRVQCGHSGGVPVSAAAVTQFGHVVTRCGWRGPDSNRATSGLWAQRANRAALPRYGVGAGVGGCRLPRLVTEVPRSVRAWLRAVSSAAGSGVAWPAISCWM